MKEPETQMTASLILAKAKWDTHNSTCLQSALVSVRSKVER